jgi:hypothetical protein
MVPYHAILHVPTKLVWMNLMTTFFDWMTLGEVRHFLHAQSKKPIAQWPCFIL